METRTIWSSWCFMSEEVCLSRFVHFYDKNMSWANLRVRAFRKQERDVNSIECKQKMFWATTSAYFSSLLTTKCQHTWCSTSASLHWPLVITVSLFHGSYWGECVCVCVCDLFVTVASCVSGKKPASCGWRSLQTSQKLRSISPHLFDWGFMELSPGHFINL